MAEATSGLPKRSPQCLKIDVQSTIPQRIIDASYLSSDQVMTRTQHVYSKLSLLDGDSLLQDESFRLKLRTHVPAGTVDDTSLSATQKGLLLYFASELIFPDRPLHGIIVTDICRDWHRYNSQWRLKLNSADGFGSIRVVSRRRLASAPRLCLDGWLETPLDIAEETVSDSPAGDGTRAHTYTYTFRQFNVPGNVLPALITGWPCIRVIIPAAEASSALASDKASTSSADATAQSTPDAPDNPSEWCQVHYRIVVLGDSAMRDQLVSAGTDVCVKLRSEAPDDQRFFTMVQAWGPATLYDLKNNMAWLSEEHDCDHHDLDEMIVLRRRQRIEARCVSGELPCVITALFECAAGFILHTRQVPLSLLLGTGVDSTTKTIRPPVPGARPSFLGREDVFLVQHLGRAKRYLRRVREEEEQAAEAEKTDELQLTLDTERFGAAGCGVVLSERQAEVEAFAPWLNRPIVCWNSFNDYGSPRQNGFAFEYLDTGERIRMINQGEDFLIVVDKRVDEQETRDGDDDDLERKEEHAEDVDAGGENAEQTLWSEPKVLYRRHCPNKWQMFLKRVPGPHYKLCVSGSESRLPMNADDWLTDGSGQSYAYSDGLVIATYPGQMHWIVPNDKIEEATKKFTERGFRVHGCPRGHEVHI